MGCDSYSHPYEWYRIICFNPRTHMGCDPPKRLAPALMAVSIHAPTWGATFHCGNLTWHILFQSTHPHGVRQAAIPALAAEPKVSIHAPTWGATSESSRLQRLCTSFNPRTHMGCDCRNILCSVQTRCFNPRTHMGCDYQAVIKELKRNGWFQSTHPHGVRPHIQQKAEYHIAKVYNLRRKTKRIILKEIKAKK